MNPYESHCIIQESRQRVSKKITKLQLRVNCKVEMGLSFEGNRGKPVDVV